MKTFAIRDEYTPMFGRQTLTIWSGDFASDLEGYAFELPEHNGYMLKVDDQKIRVECDSPRNEWNFMAVDDAISKALAAV